MAVGGQSLAVHNTSPGIGRVERQCLPQTFFKLKDNSHEGRPGAALTATPPKHFGPLQVGGGGGATRMGSGGTPTCISQKDPLVARIILNTQMWVFFKKKITSQRLLDQSQAGPYMWENATYPPPFWAFLGLFAYPTPRG